MCSEKNFETFLGKKPNLDYIKIIYSKLDFIDKYNNSTLSVNEFELLAKKTSLDVDPDDSETKIEAIFNNGEIYELTIFADATFKSIKDCFKNEINYISYVYDIGYDYYDEEYLESLRKQHDYTAWLYSAIE